MGSDIIEDVVTSSGIRRVNFHSFQHKFWCITKQLQQRWIIGEVTTQLLWRRTYRV